MVIFRFSVAEPVHPGLSSQLGTGARIFFRFILGFNSVMFSAVDNVSVDSDAPMVTL